MENRKFCIFILSYKRPNSIYTLKTLEKSNYNGDWYIICGDDDPTINEYINNYGKEKILIFNKEEVAEYTDSCDNFGKKKLCLFARNYCFEIAKQLGYDYFLELDDDYTSFEYRYIQEEKLKVMKVEEFDYIVEIMLDFLQQSNATAVAFAQGGDFIGGAKNGFVAKNRVKRKCMNSWFCCTNKPFKFLGSMNDDVNTYITLGNKGQLFFTIADVSLVQPPTQSVSGGMSDEYGDSGTYLKSFYSVMLCPSFVKVSAMGDKYFRIHHKVNWNKAVPKIISSKYQKFNE